MVTTLLILGCLLATVGIVKAGCRPSMDRRANAVPEKSPIPKDAIKHAHVAGAYFRPGMEKKHDEAQERAAAKRRAERERRRMEIEAAASRPIELVEPADNVLRIRRGK